MLQVLPNGWIFDGPKVPHQFGVVLDILRIGDDSTLKFVETSVGADVETSVGADRVIHWNWIGKPRRLGQQKSFDQGR